ISTIQKSGRKQPMDLRKLKTLIDLVAESGIAELEITEGEGKVRIVKNVPAQNGMQLMPAGWQMQPQFTAQAPAAPAAPAAPVADAPPPAVSGHVVKAPMVGTLYRAPNPGAAPFVD